MAHLLKHGRDIGIAQATVLLGERIQLIHDIGIQFVANFLPFGVGQFALHRSDVTLYQVHQLFSSTAPPSKPPSAVFNCCHSSVNCVSRAAPGSESW